MVSVQVNKLPLEVLKQIFAGNRTGQNSPYSL